MTEEVNNTPAAEVPEKKVLRLEKVGKVVSDKMEKTIVVEVSYQKKHRLYKKAMRRTSRFKAHDEQNECRIGDVVRIEECRPISKEKHFRLAEIVKRSDKI
jgi:small subunit ribosomal protein S17